VNKRLAIVLAVAVLWMLAVAGRLAALTVVDHERYLARAESQQQRRIELPPSRGTIFDVRGRALAVSVEVESAWADPAEVADPEAVAAALAGALGLDRDKLAAELSGPGRFVWLARRLDPPDAERVRALGLPGVRFQHETKRYYPNRALAAPVLGFVGTDSVGLAGVEQQYDGGITGRAGRQTVLADARRRRAVTPHLAFTAPEPGRDLVLTLDVAIQHVVERELARAVAESGAKGGTAVVLDPWSGAVLAMAAVPGFDPNRFAGYPAERLGNPVVQEVYEPGSTFKMVTASAALAANLIDPHDVIDCELGGIRLGSVLIRDHKRFGYLSFRDVIARSSNVGAIKAGLRVGRDRLHAQAAAFGFGSATGIDLPGEAAGMLHPPEAWRPNSVAYVAFGHEVTVTPLQLANAFAAVANGGTLFRPFVALERRSPDGSAERRGAPEVLGRPLAPTTAREIERLLEAVVADGTGKAAAVPGYTVAGKTGTAQKVVDRRYAPGRYIASFAGFVPARQPALVAAVVIDEPRPPLYHGGQVAAPAFAAMAEPILLYLGVPPDRAEPERWPGEADGVRLALVPSEELAG
jgi:cell division protein FtsI (penicillin-binding protein 3)